MTDITESLDEGVLHKDPYTKPISFAFNQKDRDRWEDLKNRMKEINPKASIAEYARRSLRILMDDLEALLDKLEKKS